MLEYRLLDFLGSLILVAVYIMNAVENQLNNSFMLQDFLGSQSGVI